MFLALATFCNFGLYTSTEAALPKWGSLITGPPPPAPLYPPVPALHSPEAYAAIPSMESPEVSAAPVISISASSVIGEFAPPRLPRISASPTAKTSAAPVSALDLVDSIGNLHDEPLLAELETPLMTPEVSAEPKVGEDREPKPESTTLPRNDADTRACFPSHARVKLQSGIEIPIADLQIGDIVESDPGHFSAVLLNSHADTKTRTAFIVLRTRRGSEIAASPGHYLLMGNGQLRAAHEFRMGDELFTASGVDYVISVGRATYRGLHNPQTASGKLMVRLGGAGAVQASTYTTAVRPNAAHAALAPLRLVYSRFGTSFPLLSPIVRDVFEPILASIHKITNRITGLSRSIVFDYSRGVRKCGLACEALHTLSLLVYRCYVTRKGARTQGLFNVKN